ncbi:unnamed protein product [Lampetra planeri]
MTRECMADGTWSFTFPICQPVLCQLPTKRLSLEVEALTKLEFDSVITYSCNKAQVLLGSTERMCQADGTWNGVEPECRGTSSYQGARRCARPRISDARVAGRLVARLAD